VAATSGGTPTGTAGTPNAAVMSVQGVTGGTPAPVSGTVAVSNFPGTQPVSGTVTVNALPAGANAIGTVGVTALPALPTGTNAIGQVSTNPGARTLVPLDIATVTTGGTAVAALNAGHRTAGGFLQNPPGATINLCINEISTASGTTSAGSTTCILPGQSYALAPAAGAVSVITSDSAHPFAGFGMN